MIKLAPSAIGDDVDVALDVADRDVFGRKRSSNAENVAAVSATSDRIRAAVLQHYELVWRTLRRLGVAERFVDDAAQQVLIVLTRRIDDVLPGVERAFMVSTAVRVAADFRRKQRRSREDLGLDGSAERESPSPSVETLIDRERARRLLDVVLDEMPDELRVVFVLFELEELTMLTISETLGLRPGTVASRLRRARQLFESTAARLTQAGARSR